MGLTIVQIKHGLKVIDAILNIKEEGDNLHLEMHNKNTERTEMWLNNQEVIDMNEVLENFISDKLEEIVKEGKK